MKKSIPFILVVFIVAGTVYGYSHQSASIALSPVEKQSLHDSLGDGVLSQTGLNPADAPVVAAPPPAPAAASAFGNESIQETPTPAPPFSGWQRLSSKPVLTPHGDGSESAGVFNPTVIKKDGRFQMIYRAQDGKGVSRLLFATSSDGVHFTPQTDVSIGAGQAYESAGMEDPRVVEVEGAYYLTYTGYDGSNAQLCLAVSNDLLHWDQKGIILPAGQGTWNVHWTKSGVILPQKINGKYWMYYMGDPKGSADEMGVASSEDSIHWTDASDHPVLPRRPGFFDSRVVARAETPVFRPELSWETTGQRSPTWYSSKGSCGTAAAGSSTTEGRTSTSASPRRPRADAASGLSSKSEARLNHSAIHPEGGAVGRGG
jgi:predicted GH43/DUF377 family glycosyl hydrolase